MRLLTPRLLAASLAAALAACAHEPAPERPPVAIPDGFAGAAQDGDAPAQDHDPDQRWWERLDDPALNALMEQALSRNLDLEQSWARLDQARALASQQGSQRWPQVSAELRSGRQQVAFQSPAGLQTFQANSFNAALSVSYEVDLWGRIEALGDAADLSVVASEEDLQALAMTLSGQIADTWFTILELRAQLDLLQSQDRINAQLMELVELRFSYGESAALDIYQQRQQLLATRGQEPQLQARLDSLERQLAVLAGVAPGQLAIPARRTLPSPPALPAAGVPAALLQRRPDLRAAQARVMSADRQVAAAVADRFPALRLTGSTGFQSQELADLLDNWIWSIAGSLTAPLLDGDRRDAEVTRQQAALRERLGAYARLTLQAILEVEDALGNERQQRLTIAQQEEQLLVANATLDQARALYSQGLTNYLQVLTALRNVQQTEQNLLTARRQLLSFRVQLFRALGGTWGRDLSPPENRP